MLSHCYTPTSFCVSTMIPIPKNGSGSMNDIRNYRGVALSSLLSKLFDHCGVEKMCAKFIWSRFGSHNLVVKNILMAARISSFSDFGDNYRYLSYKYGIGIHVGHLPFCKFYKCFDLFLLNHHKTIANGVFIRNLCLLREDNIIDDDQDLTSTELTYMIDFLCTS